ncbi:MAG: NAD-dependent epimerase/dehydratase family protein [Fervidicoccaceae archaeon]
MRALVTGGAGFIGSHVVEELVRRGCAVRVVDNLSTGRLENLRSCASSVEMIVGDLKDPSVALRAVEGVDVVLHFAANPEVRVSSVEPRIHFEENVVATFNVLEASRRRGVEKLALASSSSVYGEPKRIPVDEEAPLEPVSVYGASKAACEALARAYSSLYGLEVVALRYANVVGPRLRHGAIYELLLKLSSDRSRLEVLGDGTQVRSYVHVSDAVEATMIALERAPGGFSVYNVASEDWITVNELVSVMLETLGLGGVEVVHRPVLHGVGWPGDVKRIALKIDKLIGLGWRPKMRSREAVRAAVESLLEELELRDFARPPKSA